MEEALSHEFEAEARKLGPGEKISLEKATEIFSKLSKQLDEHVGESQNSRGSDGEFNDFTEQRRPFVEADQTRHSH